MLWPEYVLLKPSQAWSYPGLVIGCQVKNQALEISFSADHIRKHRQVRSILKYLKVGGHLVLSYKPRLPLDIPQGQFLCCHSSEQETREIKT